MIELGGVIGEEQGEDESVGSADAMEVGAFADPSDLPGNELLFLHDFEELGEAAPAEVEGFGRELGGVGAADKNQLIAHQTAGEEPADVHVACDPIAQGHVERGDLGRRRPFAGGRSNEDRGIRLETDDEPTLGGLEIEAVGGADGEAARGLLGFVAQQVQTAKAQVGLRATPFVEDIVLVRADEHLFDGPRVAVGNDTQFERCRAWIEL